MSIRYFCDVCEQEGDRFDRVRRKLGDVMIEVMVRYKNTWNAGHICAACVVRVAQEGEPVGEGESWLADQNRRASQSVTITGITAPMSN